MGSSVVCPGGIKLKVVHLVFGVESSLIDALHLLAHVESVEGVSYWESCAERVLIVVILIGNVPVVCVISGRCVGAGPPNRNGRCRAVLIVALDVLVVGGHAPKSSVSSVDCDLTDARVFYHKVFGVDPGVILCHELEIEGDDVVLFDIFI